MNLGAPPPAADPASSDGGGHDRQYWALFGNPGIYRVEEAVRQLATDLWTARGRDIRAGDRVVIWKGAGRDGYRGVVALGEVLTDPEMLPDADNPYWVRPPAPDDLEERVMVRYVVPSGLPLFKRREPDPILDLLSVSRATGGTVFRVTPDQWAVVVAAAGGWPSVSWEIADAQTLVEECAGRRTTDQGRLMSPEVRRAVEMHAMSRAREHFERQGWKCEDVSAKRSYDFHCTRPDHQELRVEVKGTTSDGSAVLLTPNEVANARHHYPRIALFVLADIQITKLIGAAPRANGGTYYVLEPWAIDEGRLIPIGFNYQLPPIVS